jgi:hypothetical protein
LLHVLDIKDCLDEERFVLAQFDAFDNLIELTARDEEDSDTNIAGGEDL